jgi:hypothetical protein
MMSGVTVAMAVAILSRRCWRSRIFSAYTQFLTYPHKKKVNRGKIWASGRPGNWSAPPNPGVGELLIRGSAHRQAEMGRCSVLHENDPVPSFYLHVFNLWENIKLKKVQVNVSSNGAFRKKKGPATRSQSSPQRISRSLARYFATF